MYTRGAIEIRHRGDLMESATGDHMAQDYRPGAFVYSLQG